MRIQHRLDIAAAPNRVWELTTNVEALPDCTPTMTEVVLLEPGPLEVGSTARIKQPAQRAKVWTVTELEPERRFTWTTRSLATTMTASHELTETPEGTANTLAVDIDGRLAPLIGALLQRPLLRAITMENHGIKAAAENLEDP